MENVLARCTDVQRSWLESAPSSPPSPFFLHHCSSVYGIIEDCHRASVPPCISLTPLRDISSFSEFGSLSYLPCLKGLNWSHEKISSFLALAENFASNIRVFRASELPQWSCSVNLVGFSFEHDDLIGMWLQLSQGVYTHFLLEDAYYSIANSTLITFTM